MVNVILLNPRRMEVEIKGVKRITEIFEKLNLNVDGYIVLKDGRPIPEDEEIDDNSSIELLQVFSGG